MESTVSGGIIVNLAAMVFLYASLLLVSLVILRALCRKREAFAKLADLLINLKLGKAALIIGASSILVFLLLAAILNMSAAAQVRSFLESLESCSSIMVTNSGIGPDGDSSETTIMTNRETMQRLRDVLADVEYTPIWSEGVHACQDFVKVYVYVPRKPGISVAQITGRLLDIKGPSDSKYRSYWSPDTTLCDRVRIALGLERPAIYGLEEEFRAVPDSQREAWFGTEQAWESRQSDPNSK